MSKVYLEAIADKTLHSKKFELHLHGASFIGCYMGHNFSGDEEIVNGLHISVFHHGTQVEYFVSDISEKGLFKIIFFKEGEIQIIKRTKL